MKSERYEILAGQRRWTAFKRLNKDNPGEGWNKIPCHLREPPENEVDAKAISLGEGLTQLPYTMTDIIDACDTLFKKYNDPRTVAKKTGISRKLVERYVKYARLPSLLQDNLGSITKNPKTAVNLAVEAADALAWSKDSDVPAEKVLELAKKLGEVRIKSPEVYKKLKQAAEENPELSLEIINDGDTPIRKTKGYKIVLSETISKKLESLAKRNGNDPENELIEQISRAIEMIDDDD